MALVDKVNLLAQRVATEFNAIRTALTTKEPTINGGTAAQYWRGDKAWATLDKTAVGLPNVDNTSDTTKNGAVATLTNKTLGSPTDVTSITTPAAPAAGRARLFAATGTGGFDALQYLNTFGIPVVLGRDVLFVAKNTTGATLTKGTAVYISGATGANPLIAKAQADATMTKIPCAGLVAADIPNNGFGVVMVAGVLDTDTSAFTDGAKLWLSATTPGGLTAVNTTHPQVTQPIGVVQNSGSGNGAILVNVVIVNPNGYDGVNGSSWAVGDGTGTTKSYLVKNAAGVGTLSWNPTAARTLTLPDTTGTVAVTADVAGKEPTIAAGTTAQYWRGDKSWATLDKASVGLGSLDNTADNVKAVLSATKLATARTINGVSFDGTGNITIPTTDATKEPIINAGTTAQYWRGDKSWQALNAGAVGLGSVDNTADSAKNVLSATKLTTARTINGVSFDGTGNITVGATDSSKEPTIAAGTTAQYWRGDKSFQTLDKSAVGLGSVDNTADSAKNVLSATKLTTARTINGTSFDGTANITVADDTKEPDITAGTTAQYWRGDKTFQTLNAAAVGLGSVNNTADSAKPVSTAQQTEIDTKVDNVSGATGLWIGTAASLPGTGTVGVLYITY